MDNLKSPYLEVYALIIFLSLVFASIFIILTASPELASKLGNTGSFLGGVVAVLAFCLGIKEYLKYTRHRGFNDLNRLKNELLPTFEKELDLNQVILLVLVSNISKNDNPEIIKRNIKYIDALAVKTYFIDFRIKVETSLNLVMSASPHLKSDLEEIRDAFISNILVWENAAIFCYHFQADEKSLPLKKDYKKEFLTALNESEIYTAFTKSDNEGYEAFKKYSDELKALIKRIKGLN